MYIYWNRNNGAWQAPAPISPENFAPPNSNCSMVYYPVNNQLEVFVVGNNGSVYVIWKENNGPWRNPRAITAPNFAPPGASISGTYYPRNNQLEVFVVGNNGSVYVIWKENNGPWRNPRAITIPVLTPGIEIASVYYPVNNQLEVFVGASFGLNVIWKENNGPWGNPRGITALRFIPENASISATYYPRNNQLEVFIVGYDGSVYVLWKANNGPWGNPVPISGAGFALHG